MILNFTFNKFYSQTVFEALKLSFRPNFVVIYDGDCHRIGQKTTTKLVEITVLVVQK